jgi:hypothetical protein
VDDRRVAHDADDDVVRLQAEEQEWLRRVREKRRTIEQRAVRQRAQECPSPD